MKNGVSAERDKEENEENEQRLSGQLVAVDVRCVVGCVVRIGDMSVSLSLSLGVCMLVRQAQLRFGLDMRRVAV